MGRPDKGNESWDRERLTATRLAALNGRVTSPRTGKHRAISTTTGEYRAMPQRPPNMPHVNENPERRRVPRPEYQPKQPRRLRPRLIIILGAIAAIIAVIVFVIFSTLLGAIYQNAGPATTTTHFLSSISTPGQSYNDAYRDLGPAVTIRINRQDFTQQAQALDTQYGAITSYSESDGSATVNNNTESFTYTITRAKSSKSYKLTILLQRDPNDSNSWKIVDYGVNCNATACYGTTLGPT